MKPFPTSRRSAFTLLEILLVVLVIAIAVGAVLPVALNTADQARTRSFLRQVIALNQYARSRAVLDVAPMDLVYDPDQGLIFLQASEPSGSAWGIGTAPLQEDGETAGMLMRRAVPHTMRLRELKGGVERDGVHIITFDPDGVGPSYEVEIVDPRGETRRLQFNGFTGEVDEID
jgi:prepilin-type N-terminal cleavage/methylation domain-containing protein